ncbi:nuclear body protein SP140 isoform X3 [Micropterus dolomieu]|uniref:nuclear body protein SP140 isoform X3 n=1 Tax=Micropterus dolomieu TaxID=147949 RepID=UPI001E8CA37F|nr:nuclear body protein SP140 isoform X3 [Micropterus dolomieu]
MDPLDFLESDELLRFFRRHKTEMSCMEDPHIFLCQLKDHDLIADDAYKKVSRMRSKKNITKGLYDILDLLERNRSSHIKVFWSCVFKEPILNHYPTLRMLRNSLMDGSFHFDIQLPEKGESEETDEGEWKELSEDEEGEEKKANSVKKKRKLRSSSVCYEDEQAGPSSQLTPGQRKKSKRIRFSSPLKKGENNAIWNWPLYKLQLPVTCGRQEGILDRNRLAKGQKCIVVKRQWFTPTEFEKFAGKESYKNWKMSIRCMNTPLGKLIKAKKSLFPADRLITVSEGEEDEDEECDLDKEDQVSLSSRESSAHVTDEEGEAEAQTEEQPEASHDSSKKVFKVTCGAVAGTLHKKRFASGTCGKSIRTETSWMSPAEFTKEASCQTDATWRKDIKWEGKPLCVLIEAKVLKIHSPLCPCRLCKPDSKDLENQKNDDECCICKSEEEEEELVVCDQCPRSFHQKCHLPHLEDDIIGDDTPWMCTFCVFKTNQDCYYWDELEWEAAMSRQISQHMLVSIHSECQYLLLCLWSADEEQTFARNPSLYLRDYSTVIKTPMWLGNVADKLQEQLYKTVGEFVSDVQLIFTNCASYNRDNAEFLAMGNRLKEFFDGELKKVLHIC